MYKCTLTICCDVCQSEIKVVPELPVDAVFNVYGGHICYGCIRTVGYAHSFDLAEAALKQFDPQTYDNVDNNAELVWQVGDKYLSHSELVDLTHPKGKKDNDRD